jgi:DNA-binding transcriptional regulator YbjK
MVDAPRTPRMELLLASALHVVAEQGLRGLTHRAVDRQAGLPEGSCSAYLRTRKALVLALTDYVAARITDDVEGLGAELASCPLDEDAAIDRVTAFFMHWLDQRELLLARIELSLESARDPDLAAALLGDRTRLTGLVESILAARGKDHSAERAQTMVASCDGILFAALPRPARQQRGFVRQSIEVLMGGLG